MPDTSSGFLHGHWMTGETLAFTGEIKRAREILDGRAEETVRALWDEIDDLIETQVANRLRATKHNSLGAFAHPTRYNRARRCTAPTELTASDSGMILVAIAGGFKLGSVPDRDLPTIIATVLLHEAAVGNQTGLLAAAAMLQTSKTQGAEKLLSELRPYAERGRKSTEGARKGGLKGGGALRDEASDLHRRVAERARSRLANGFPERQLVKTLAEHFQLSDRQIRNILDAQGVKEMKRKRK